MQARTVTERADPAMGDAAMPRTDPARVVVFIPTLNEEAHIARVVEELLGSDPFAARCRVIVADGGSTDRTREIVEGMQDRFPLLALLDNPGRLQASAMNLALGAEFAGAETLIRCDAHSFYPPGFVSALVSALEARPEASSIVIPMDTLAEGGCFRRALAWISDTPLGAGGSPHRGGSRSAWVDHGHHAAFRMEMFRKIGGYDPSFIANEDAEYDRRVTQAGGRIWLEAAIRIGYLPRSTPRGLAKQYYRYGQGRARTCLKHRVRPAPRQLIPAMHVALCVLSVAMLPFTPLGLAWPLVYLATIAAAGIWMTLRHRSACGLLAGVAVAVMHTCWGAGFLLTLARGGGPNR
ncbi:MAG: glycosyltransferase family 2 protein [Pseudomonadota bacterium]